MGTAFLCTILHRTKSTKIFLGFALLALTSHKRFLLSIWSFKRNLALSKTINQALDYIRKLHSTSLAGLWFKSLFFNFIFLINFEFFWNFNYKFSLPHQISILRVKVLQYIYSLWVVLFQIILRFFFFCLMWGTGGFSIGFTLGSPSSTCDVNQPWEHQLQVG